MIRALPDPESVSRAAAETFAREAAAAVAARGRFAVALSGGASPRRAYEMLASSPLRDRVAWDRVHAFWTDERCVPPHDARSNARMARTALLDRVPIPAAHVHPIECAKAPAEAAARYEETLRAFFGPALPRFDLVFLGLGDNGHTASLFPGTPAAAETSRWAVEVFVEEEGLHRVTLTSPVINAASRIAFIVFGAAKARVIARVLEGPSEPDLLPAQLVRPADGELEWLVDREAASLLSRTVVRDGTSGS